jgi:hypothetical protein
MEIILYILLGYIISGLIVHKLLIILEPFCEKGLIPTYFFILFMLYSIPTLYIIMYSVFLFCSCLFVPIYLYRKLSGEKNIEWVPLVFTKIHTE